MRLPTSGGSLNSPSGYRRSAACSAECSTGSRARHAPAGPPGRHHEDRRVGEPTPGQASGNPKFIAVAYVTDIRHLWWPSIHARYHRAAPRERRSGSPPELQRSSSVEICLSRTIPRRQPLSTGMRGRIGRTSCPSSVPVRTASYLSGRALPCSISPRPVCRG